eukprot:scaffold12732_cov25-Prasinocladus_malaysianus.AAC.1
MDVRGTHSREVAWSGRHFYECRAIQVAAGVAPASRTSSGLRAFRRPAASLPETPLPSGVRVGSPRFGILATPATKYVRREAAYFLSELSGLQKSPRSIIVGDEVSRLLLYEYGLALLAVPDSDYGYEDSYGLSCKAGVCASWYEYSYRTRTRPSPICIPYSKIATADLVSSRIPARQKRTILRDLLQLQLLVKARARKTSVCFYVVSRTVVRVQKACSGTR